MLSDSPVKPEVSLDSPSFQSIIEPLVTSLTGLMEGEDGCITASVCGDWGTGKTTVLRALESFFRDCCEFPVLFFEAWRFKEDGSPLLSLLSEFYRLPAVRKSKEIERELNFLSKTIISGIYLLGDFSLREFSKKFLPFELSFSNVKKAVDFARDFVDSYSGEVLKFRSQYRENLRKLSDLIEMIRNSKEVEVNKELKEKWENLFNGYNFRERLDGKWFVLIIDDLDRLLPEDALRFIETLRFYFNVDRTLILMGINDKVLNAHLQKVLDLPLGGFNGESFLEKVFQWSYELSYGRLNDLHLRGLRRAGMDDETLSEVKRLLEELVEYLSHRKWIKLLNRVEKKWRIDRSGSIEKIVALSIVKELFPKLETEMRRSPGMSYEVLEGKLRELLGEEELLESPFFRSPKAVIERLAEALKRKEEEEEV